MFSAPSPLPSFLPVLVIAPPTASATFWSLMNLLVSAAATPPLRVSKPTFDCPSESGPAASARLVMPVLVPSSGGAGGGVV